MKTKTSFFSRRLLHIVISSSLLVAGCSKNSNSVSAPTAGTVAGDTISIVSTPNPNLFPLLLAMADNPGLKVKIIPVGTYGEFRDKLVSGSADALVAMSYMAAKLVTTGAVPDLKLKSVGYWNGFYEITHSGISSFNDLKGKRLVISGPVGTGQNGGPDIIFQAAMKRVGLVPGTDFQISYVNLTDGTQQVAGGQQDAILLAEPAGTAFTVMGTMNGADLKKNISIQSIFSGFTQWPANQLPLGGLSVKNSVLQNSAKKITFDLVQQLYEQKAAQIMQGNLSDAMKMTDKLNTIYAGLLSQTFPAPAIVKAIKDNTLLYRNDKTVQSIKTDLDSWIKELLGSSPGDGFYN